MPFVDGVVVLHTRICAGPGCFVNCIPYFRSRLSLHYLSGAAGSEFPLFPFGQFLKETVGNAEGIVRVLTRYGGISFAFVVVAVTGCDEGGYLALFLLLPLDELHGFGVIEVEAYHFGCTAGGSARLDGTGCAVADLEEAHEAGRGSAATELFTGTADAAEVGTHAGTVFEDTRFTHPEVHDAAFIYQVVINGKNEACMGLRTLVCGSGALQFFGFRIHEIVALGLAGNSIAAVQAGIEPLRRVRSRFLIEHGVHQLIIEHVGIFRAGEVSVFETPFAPAVGHAVHHLLDAGFATGRTIGLGDTGFAEIFLCEDVGSYLAPARRNFHIEHFKDH